MVGGVVINMPGILSLNTVSGGVARGDFVWNDELYMVFSTDLIKITDTSTGAFDTIGTIAGTDDIRVAIGFNDAVIVVNSSTGNIYALSNSNTANEITITGVTDSGGVASFTHAGTTPAVGNTVTNSGFITNTAYNVTGIVTASTATTFEISSIAFGTDEAGVFVLVLSEIQGNSNFVSCADVTHINGRFVYIPFSGDPAFFSDVGLAGTVNALSFFDAEELPDKNNGVFNFRNTLYIMGTDSIESFKDTGASPNPFIRRTGARIDNGFIGAKLEYFQTWLFVGKEKDQDFGVYALAEGIAIKISNERIDLILSTYTPTQLATGIPGRIKWRGYDMATFRVVNDSFGFYKGNWFILSTTSDGTTVVWDGEHITQFEGKYYSASNANIGVFDKISTNYGEPMPKLIETVLEKEDNKWFSCKKIELGISQGFQEDLSFNITSVTNSSGVAQFNFTPNPLVSLAIGQQITNSGFVTNTDYNGSFIITATSGTSNFQISSIAFGTSETVGSFVPVDISGGSVALQTSRDNVNFDDEVFRDLGNLGEYNKRLIWKYAGGIGKFQGFMGIRFKSSENIDFSSQFIDIEAS